MPDATASPSAAPYAAGGASEARRSGQLTRSVVLIGLMGAGKTSVGRRLADALSVPFRDSDDEIATAAGMDIPTIFSTLGEPAFREGERKVIARLLAAPPHVLATGGGAFMDASTRAVVSQAGVSVWIRADLDTLVERTGRKNDRPLLRVGDPRVILERLMREREPVYSEATITVHSALGGTQDVVVADIIAALRARGFLAGDGADDQR